MAVKPYRLSLLKPWLFVEGWVHIVHIFLVHPVLGQPQSLAEALEVDNLSGPQEADGVGDVRVVAHAQNVVIGKPGLLLCGQVLGQVRDGVAGDGDALRAPGGTGGGGGVDRGGVINEVGGESALLNVIFREVPGQLVNDGSHHLQMAQLLGTWIVSGFAHPDAECFQPSGPTRSPQNYFNRFCASLVSGMRSFRSRSDRLNFLFSAEKWAMPKPIFLR